MKKIILSLFVLANIYLAQNENPSYHKIYKQGNTEVEISENEKSDPNFSGLKILSYLIEIKDNNTVIRKEGELSRGGISDSGIRDFDGDGEIEIFIVYTSDGSGAYGNLIFYELSQSELVLHQLPELNSNIRSYYQGHDNITVEENKIIRTFPGYNKNDANCCPTAGEITVEYRFNNSKFIESGYSFVDENSKKNGKSNKIVLTIERARNLPNMDAFSACDSWLEVIINDNLIGTTPMQKDNNAPIYNASFELDSSQQGQLLIKVYDKDLTKNELVGIVTLNKYTSGVYPILKEVSNGNTQKFGELILDFDQK